MLDFINLGCAPYASTFQKRFATTEGGNDGYNPALIRAGYKLNKRPIDQDNDTCVECGCNGHTKLGRLQKWADGELHCLKHYQLRYQRERYAKSKLEAK